MGRRMSHSAKRARSQYEQFRMVVPKDIRHLVGRTEWTASLGTTDALEAKAKRAHLIEHYSTEITRLRDGARQQLLNTALVDVDRAFERLARARGSMDKAIAEQLQCLANCVCESWLPQQEPENQVWWRDFLVTEPSIKIRPVPSIDTEEDRSRYRLRALLLEGRGVADGLVHQELARAVLARRAYAPIFYVVSYLKSFEPKLDLEHGSYDTVAEAYLKRLSEHRFENWPANIHEALLPTGTAGSGSREPSLTHAASSPTIAHSHQGLLAKRLSEALTYWQEERRPGSSAVVEATRAVARFKSVFGDMVIGDIDRSIVIEFRNLIAQLPPQIELSRIETAGITLREVAAEAQKTRAAWLAGSRETPEPERLAPGSVKKDIGALSQVIGKIVLDGGVGVNPAANVEIAGYSKKRSGQKTPHLPFTSQMMQRLFDSPLFTGCAGRGVAARAKPGTFVFQDEMYWCFLFGVVGGPRLGEIGQIALTDVHECDLRRTYGSDYDGSCTYVHITGTGKGQHVKNDESDRYVVIHERLIELGFNAYVDQRRAAGKQRLLDLDPDRNGSFTKELSRRLNRYLDRVVTSDPRYVFHSSRHEFTDRADLSLMPTRVANSIKGHANNTVADEYGLVSILHQYVHLKRLKLDFIDWARLTAAVKDSPA